MPANPWIKKPKKKKLPGMTTGPTPTIQKRSCAVKYNDIIFSNIPDFSHVAVKGRHSAANQHAAWESELACESRVNLHRSIYPRKDGWIPRQTCAWLISQYCAKTHVSYETLMNTISKANGDIDTAGLLTLRPTDNKGVVNLQKLANETMYRLYCEIPHEHRPQQAPDAGPCLNKKQELEIAQKPALVNPHEMVQVIVEEKVTWVGCDACSKWRRVVGMAEDAVPEKWWCNMHPSGCITCDTPEDTMEYDEKWNGEVAGNPEAAGAPAGSGGGMVGEAPNGDDDDADFDGDLFGSDNDSDFEEPSGAPGPPGPTPSAIDAESEDEVFFSPEDIAADT